MIIINEYLLRKSFNLLVAIPERNLMAMAPFFIFSVLEFARQKNGQWQLKKMYLLDE